MGIPKVKKMRMKQSNLWKNEDVKENIEHLRKASGPINEEIISYCDYGSKCEAGLIYFLTKEFSDINIELEDSDKEYLWKRFNHKGINYYSIKEYILEVFDTLYPDKITFIEVLESRFPILRSDHGDLLVGGKSKNITIEVSVCSKAGYQFLEDLLMSPTLGEEFKAKYGIILEKVYINEVSMSGNALDLLKEATKKLEKFQNESGVKIC